jgi:peptidoglycan/LPS O-acetylase OafA/YrhL
MTLYVAWRRLNRLKVGNLPATLLESVALLTLVAWFAVGYPTVAPLLAWSAGISTWFVGSSACLAFGGVILAFASGQGLLSRLLSLRPFVWLGEVSFALYMVHQVLMKYLHIGVLLGRWESPSMPLVFALCLGSAALLHHAVELPARRLILRLLDRRGRAGIRAVPAALRP